jgi:microcin C transport system substrate-binding protein
MIEGITKGAMKRRSFLTAAAALPLLGLSGGASEADEWASASHGLSMFGDLKYPKDFKQFDYVDGNAPKGGVLSLMPATVIFNQSFQTFNSLNIFILSGDGAPGMDLCFDTLMVRAFDEPDAVYGLVADRVVQQGLVARFRLRPEARFHDGAPLTAKDVAWSFRTFIDKGHPQFKQIVGSIKSVEAVGLHEVKVTLPENHSRGLLMDFASLPILSKSYYATRDFTAITLDPPLGSGPYKVSRAIPGRSVEYERVAKYWAADLPVRRGHHNFEWMRFDIHAERAAGLLAFKAREYEFREEFTSRAWATEYAFDAVTDGRVKREEIEDGTISGGQGWYLNLRRQKFQDVRVREALQLVFDFEWSNANLFFGSYKRSHSLFQGAEFMAAGKAGADESAIIDGLGMLEPALRETLKGEPVLMQLSDGSGSDRKLLARANQLLLEAGCKREGARLQAPDGSPFTFEVLDDDDSFARVVGPFVENLKRLGIDASHRIVDGPQYQERSKRFDFDTLSLRQVVPTTPGEELRYYLGSESAKTEGSRNLAGLADPAVDALIARCLAATDRDALNLNLRVLDRLLRARRYWIPHWHKGTHWLAYWDVFGRPAQKPKYDRGVILTWWRDAANTAGKAQ